MEYGFRPWAYEVAGGLGVKLAKPDSDVIVMVGDGSYMMLNSEIASSVMLGAQIHRRAARTMPAMVASTGCRWERAAPTSTIC